MATTPSTACREMSGWRNIGMVLASAVLVVVLQLGWERSPSRLNEPLPSNFPKIDPPKTLFVFLAGIEGTGHHFYEKLYGDSSEKLKAIASDGTVMLNQDLTTLQTSLYNDMQPQQALFTGSLGYKRKKIHPEGHALFQSIVRQLNTTNEKVLRWLEAQNETTTFPIPLNAYRTRGPFGMISYPNYLLPSRPLQYPDLHLLYRACEAAEVACGHAYLHRDPYEVIESTVTKRHFGTEDDQIKLYTTMMGVLRSQLIDLKHKSIGCLDFDHLEGPDFDRFLRLFGISPEAFQSIYNPPKPENITVSPYLQIYMDTFVETSQTTWDTCLEMESEGWFAGR